MKSRRERREEARANGVPFEPQYNGRVITKAEYDKEVKELKELRKNKLKKSSNTESTATEEATE